MHDEDRPTHRLKGRRSAPTGDTPEANDLAEWLRARVDGLGAGQLEGLFPFGRTRWNEFLNGRKLIPSWLLDDVVRKLVGAEGQENQLRVGRELLRAAEEADAARLVAGSHDVLPGAEHNYEIGLVDARSNHDVALRTVKDLTHLIFIFSSAVEDLKQRCAALKAERDQAHQRLEQQATESTVNQQRAAEARQRADASQRLLAEAERRIAEIEKRRNRAYGQRDDAEELRIEAFQQAELHRRSLLQLTGRDTPAALGSGDSGAVPSLQPWYNDRFIEVADTYLDRCDDQVDAVREQRDSYLPPAFQGYVVHPPPMAREDGPTARGGPTHGSLRETPEYDSGNASGGFAATPEDHNQQRSPAPSPRGAEARKNPGTRVALIGVTCLALLAGGGYLAWDQLHDSSASKGASAAPRGESAASKSDAPEPEDEALDRLNKARESHGDFKFVVGVKNNQPGVSNKERGKWVGVEIDYAKKVLDELGLVSGQYEFKSVPTVDREIRLNEGGGGGGAGEQGVDIFVGTYGITDERKDGSADRPAVIFAGPYLRAPQKILMQKDRQRGGNVLIQGRSETVNLPIDLPEDAQVCVVSGSTAEVYVNELKKKNKKFPSEITSRSEYKLCTDKLTKYKGQDAVLTDGMILRGIQLSYRNPEDYFLTSFSFKVEEGYGIGLSEHSLALKGEVCSAMSRVKSQRGDIYKNFKKDVIFEGQWEMKECSRKFWTKKQ
ncbi:transporter substrate-binding domain-containing protein [Streptomyces sp. NPDC058195]|uniref:transporter substrate-binding domain-containing protein n=1 Tax=Streptomyces sp. NPDC058195 TaxID=3346375 RepID=UPI0036EC71AF